MDTGVARNSFVIVFLGKCSDSDSRWHIDANIWWQNNFTQFNYFIGDFLSYNTMGGLLRFLNIWIFFCYFRNLFENERFSSGGAIGLIMTRTLIGVTQGPLIPSIASIMIAWIPVEERTRCCAIAYMGIHVNNAKCILLKWSKKSNLRVFFFKNDRLVVFCRLTLLE